MILSVLSEEFSSAYMSVRLRPSTFRGYTVNIKNHILPYLGNREITSISVDDLD